MSPIWDADHWPLEAAIAWILYGDKQLFETVAAIALQRRAHPLLTLPTLSHRLLVNEGLAAGPEAVDGSLYRERMRRDWTPGDICGDAEHPIRRAFARAEKMLRKIPSWGCRGLSRRAPIPPEDRKSAIIMDDRRLGLTLRAPEQTDDFAWRHIDVPAMPFRALGAKRGRRPAGLGDSARLTHQGDKTIQRKRTQQKQRAERRGTPVPQKRPKTGRPKGSRNAPH